MAKQPRQGRTFERRNGQEGFAWEGIATKVDPAGAPPNRPRDLVNVRLQGGVIISRPSFQGDGALIPLLPKYYTGAIDPAENPPFAVQSVGRWIPHWLGEHNSAAGTRLWMVSETATAFSEAQLSFLDTDADLAFQQVAAVPLQGSGFSLPIEKFNNEFYFGDYGGLRKLYLIPSTEGSSAPPVDATLLSDEVVAAYPGFRTGALQELDGKLFFGIVGAPNGEIFAWDGLGIAPETSLTTSGAAGMVMAVFQDTLVVAVRDETAPGQGALLVRDATGAWTVHTIVGFNPSRYPNSMAEYGGLLYILDSVDGIYTWDGTNIVLAHTLPAAGVDLNCCAKLSGRLYFAWADVTNGVTELGYVDQDNAPGSKFVDYGTEAGVWAPDNNVTAMAQYRGRLWLSFNDSVFGCVVAWHSMQFMPYAGWQTTVDPGIFSSSSPVGDIISNMRTL